MARVLFICRVEIFHSPLLGQKAKYEVTYQFDGPCFHELLKSLLILAIKRDQ